MKDIEAVSVVVRVALAAALYAFTGMLGAATAEPYRFEMIVFERPGNADGEAWPAEPGRPDRQQARSTLGSNVPRAERELGPVAYTLRRRGLTVLAHLNWQQVPGSRNGGAWRWLDAGRLQGLVRVSRGRFLHLDTDLLLRDPGMATAYRVRLNRRMRSNELHYVDHPKLGIVIQARRVAPNQAAPIDEDQGEPKPATPVASPGGAG
jgi:hypothetical protein